jgi:hypothetical protein
VTEAEARSAIASATAATAEPVLTDAELTALVRLARRADSEGVAPGELGWVETYDVNAAAAEGWRWKAGKVAGAFTFSTDGQSFQRAQIYAHCLKQAQLYATRNVGTYGVRRPDPAEVIGNLG